MMGPLVTDLSGKTIRNFAVDHGSQPLGALLLLGYMVSRILAAVPTAGYALACPPTRQVANASASPMIVRFDVSNEVSDGRWPCDGRYFTPTIWG